MSVAVLTEELKRGESRYAGPSPSGASAPQRPSNRPSASAPQRRGGGDERNLVRALLADGDWVTRARQDGITPEWFDRAEYQEILTFLLTGRAGELPEALSTEGALAWSELKESLAQFDPAGTGDIYEASREALEARPQFREFEKLMKAIEHAPVGAKDQLIMERESRRAVLSKKYPAAWKRWYTRRGIR